MNAPPFRWQLLAPRHWPTWLGLGLLRALCWLPVPWLLRLGRGLGALAGRLAGRRHDIVLTNLRLCFPDLPEEECARLAKAHFRDLGMGALEACLAWWASDRRLRGLGHVEGLEHLQAAQREGHGVLLLTGHFTTLEIGARFLCLAGVRFHAMYRPYKNPVMDYLMHRWRARRSGLPALPREDLRALVRALRRGAAVWYAPDQTLDMRHSVFAPFFAEPALTITATSRLAQMGRAKVVPFFPVREEGRYRVVILPALNDFPSSDDTVDAARINAAIEQGVRLAPPQYFWVHRRFKVRPPGAGDAYADD